MSTTALVLFGAFKLKILSGLKSIIASLFGMGRAAQVAGAQVAGAMARTAAAGRGAAAATASSAAAGAAAANAGMKGAAAASLLSWRGAIAGISKLHD